MTDPLRFAIVGSGMIARVHARALAGLGEGLSGDQVRRARHGHL